MQELLREIRELRVQFAQQNRNRQGLHIGPTWDTFFSHDPVLDLTYGLTTRDVRHQPGTSDSFLTLKEARNMIPEIDGSPRNRVREFLNASTYAMKNVHPADETTLLEAMLCIKFRGKAMMDFHTRRDDAPMEYDGILGTDFIRRHKVVANYNTRCVSIGKAQFKLQPYIRIKLKPRSETVVQCTANKNKLGITKAEETAPGIFI
ncbi:hypothetical protein ALC57_00582 [Trachymyrmex cornetzi]|uniref:Uncharacterized protein n=1 Tax=Trachymyrmex cornetzi TaxID=471704 RepID=A0A151JRI2_9HYME|nr:hypothetical protein ALC57_00582 [Trachymyrmex cornetzi]